MRPLKNMCEVAVIGGGMAGLSAARHAARLGRMVTLFEGTGLYGGLVATIGEVEGLPVPGEFSGQDLAMPLLTDARKVGVQIVETEISAIDLGEKLTITAEDGKAYHPDAIIFATGARMRKLGVPGEEEMTGRGVSRCATCDGGFFRGKDVVVVGGGDGAVHEALVLSRTSGNVIMISRSPLRAKREYIDKLDARENVTFIWDSEVTAILDDGSGVSGVSVRNLKTGEVSQIECAGVFPFIGGEPNSDMLPASMLQSTGHVKTGTAFETSDPRIFAAGAVRADYDGNLVQAMAEGVSVAGAAARYLAQK